MDDVINILFHVLIKSMLLRDCSEIDTRAYRLVCHCFVLTTF